MFWYFSDAYIIIDQSPANVRFDSITTLSTRCTFLRNEATNIVHPLAIVLAQSKNLDTNFQNIASVFLCSDPRKIKERSENVKVDGKINGSSSYLQYEVHFPTSIDFGFYRCTVSGLDRSYDVIHEIKVSEIQSSSSTVSELLAENRKLVDRVVKLENQVKVFSDSCVKSTDLQRRQNNITQENDEKFKDVHNKLSLLNESNHFLASTHNSSKEIMFRTQFSFENSTYYLSRFGVDRFHSAEIVCATYGGYLAEIDTASEYNVIVHSIKPHVQKESPFIGLVTDGSSNNWIYSFSKTPAKYLLWNPNGDPSIGKNENCVVLSPTYGFTMANIPCNNYLNMPWHYLCEVTPQKFT
ncbi:collectin-11 [Biomphalaria glabrata]|nr:collectin-11 [Biomphalaria glabrata]